MDFNPYAFQNPLLSITTLLSLVHKAKQEFKTLPQEEQDRITAEREVIQEQKRVAACIQQGKCPHCLGKLTRGKKDKKNGYKRIWKCTKCNEEVIC